MKTIRYDIKNTTGRAGYACRVLIKRLFLFVLILNSVFAAGQNIPESEGPDIYGTRHFISLDGTDTLAISMPGDTIFFDSTDSIYIDKLLNTAAGGGVTDHGNLTGLDDSSDHPWALEFADTTDVVATQYYVENEATAYDAGRLGNILPENYLRSDQDDTMEGKLTITPNDDQWGSYFSISDREEDGEGNLEPYRSWSINTGSGGYYTSDSWFPLFETRNDNGFPSMYYSAKTKVVPNNEVIGFNAVYRGDSALHDNDMLAAFKSGFGNRLVKIYGDGDIVSEGTMTMNGSDLVATENWVENDAKAADSDKLDGLDSGSFLRSDTTDNVNGVLTFNKRPVFLNERSLGSTVKPSNIIGFQYGKGRYFDGGSGASMSVISDIARGFHLYVNPSSDMYFRSVQEYWGDTDGWSDWNKIWHSGNDGSGSGLDADKLDGLHASQFEPKITKNTAFNKNFGTTAGTVAEGNDSRILNGQTAYSWGDHSVQGYATETWVGNNYLGVNAKAVDADKLDGLHASQFLRSDESDTMYGNLTVQGSGAFVNNNRGEGDSILKLYKAHTSTSVERRTGIEFNYNDKGYVVYTRSSNTWANNPEFNIAYGRDIDNVTPYFTIKTGGNVGIGTTSPTEALDVNGNVKASGNIVAGGEVTANNINTTVQSLSGTTVTWNVSSGHNATITLSGNTTITMSNLVAGTTGNLTVTNPSTAYDITFSGYTILITPNLSPATDTVTMSGGSATDVLSWYYDGSQVIINGTLAYE